MVIIITTITINCDGATLQLKLTLDFSHGNKLDKEIQYLYRWIEEHKWDRGKK
jgi:hypothetical protein